MMLLKVYPTICYFKCGCCGYLSITLWISLAFTAKFTYFSKSESLSTFIRYGLSSLAISFIVSMTLSSDSLHWQLIPLFFNSYFLFPAGSFLPPGWLEPRFLCILFVFIRELKHFSPSKSYLTYLLIDD